MFTDANSQMWLGTVIMFSVPIYLAVQVWLAVAWRGGWRIAALVPLLLAVPALAMSAYAISGGSNLGPLVFILASPIGLLYLVVASAVRWLARPAAA